MIASSLGASKLRYALVLIAASWMSIASTTAARADTVASLLGNFTINQYTGLVIGADRAEVRYVVVFGQLPALRELHEADSDNDGLTTTAERDAYLARLADDYIRNLKMTVGDAVVPLHVDHLSSSLPSEQAGFSLRFEAVFAGPLVASPAGQHVHFTNSNYAGRIGWNEVQLLSRGGVNLFDADRFGDSLTDGLSVNPKALPPNGPLDERDAEFSFVEGALPRGARPLQLRDGSAKPVQPESTGGNWLEIQTKRLISLLSAPEVTVQFKLLALLGAFVLGALHAFSPGHGKTVVGAYLIGSRGTPRHAVFLGAIVTITHTLGVFLLGFATLFAANYVVPERLFPIISLISGLLVVGIGATLFAQRLKLLRLAKTPMQFVAVEASGRGSLALASFPGSLGLADHGHGNHGHEHGHAHGALVHSHGGSTHSHLPVEGPEGRVTWQSLLALGISGGLIPCPSAMVLLLAAVALNKTALGLLLVVAFSVGLAATLTLVGLLFLYARRLLPQSGRDNPWTQRLPVASAALITLVGIAICYSALVNTP